MKLTIVEKNLLSWTAMHIDFVMCNNWEKNQVQFPALANSALEYYIYQVNEYGVTEVTLFPVRGKVFLQQTSKC